MSKVLLLRYFYIKQQNLKRSLTLTPCCSSSTIHFIDSSDWPPTRESIFIQPQNLFPRRPPLSHVTTGKQLHFEHQRTRHKSYTVND